MIDGKAVAAEVSERVAEGVARVRRPRNGTRPGSRRCWSATTRPRRSTSPASASLTEEVGMRSFHHGARCRDADRRSCSSWSASSTRDETVDGILVQLPLPEQVDQDAVISAIDPAKDVDGLTARQRRAAGAGPARARPVHAARRDRADRARPAREIEGAEAVVLGRSILVGRPLAPCCRCQRHRHHLPLAHPRSRRGLRRAPTS